MAAELAALRTLSRRTLRAGAAAVAAPALRPRRSAPAGDLRQLPGDRRRRCWVPDATTTRPDAGRCRASAGRFPGARWSASTACR